MFQAMSFTAKGLSTAYVTGEGGNDSMKRGVHKGVYSLVFFTPELLISSLCKVAKAFSQRYL